jgi:phosphoribosylformylglycinamidine (FGAM) synthase-like enzyme
VNISNAIKITPELVAEHGLKPDEYERILKLIGREPSITELGIFSVMWNEHCSYKSSKVHLKTLPDDRPWVIQGPGRKRRRHRHRRRPGHASSRWKATTTRRSSSPIRARRRASAASCATSSPWAPARLRVSTRCASASRSSEDAHLVSGVVAGIGGYGNCLGVPTVGGEVNFHPRYNGNILVNAMCGGPRRRRQDLLRQSRRRRAMPVVYVGSKTGRDGIHGATMASAEFDEGAEEKRPTVQVGDPFAEKLLLEACLELMAKDAIVAIQDMGAAGLTSLRGRDGREGRSWHRRSTSRRCRCAKKRHERLTK